MAYMATSQHKNQGVMKFTIFVDPYSVITTIYLVCLNHAQE